jgi:hypothetical protein
MNLSGGIGLWHIGPKKATSPPEEALLFGRFHPIELLLIGKMIAKFNKPLEFLDALCLSTPILLCAGECGKA